MSNEVSPYKMIILTRRIKSPGLVETMSEQVPEMKIAFAEIQDMLVKRLNQLDDPSWHVISHAQNIYNGILIVSFMLESRQAEAHT